MKLGIIGGAGLLGSTTAFTVGIRDIFSEIKLVDYKENILESHVMDLTQALLPLSKTKVSSCQINDLEDCDIILITASVPERKVSNRNDFLHENYNIISTICAQLEKNTKEAIIICCTNPVDVFNYVLWKHLKWNKRKFIGFSYNDTLRFKWAISGLINQPYDKISALCIGEHGDGMIRLFNQIKINDKPLVLSEKEQNKIISKTDSWFSKYQSLDSNRTSGWTSAITLTYIIESIANESNDIIPCSVILENDFGYNSVSIGLPVNLDRNGVNEIFFPELIQYQSEKFDEIVRKIQNLINIII